MQTEIDVLVIGASQAGLAAAFYLKENNVNYMVIGKDKRIGDTWRNRYDSLVLFTPRKYSALPGLEIQGNQDGYATKDEIADYLEQYANRFDLPVRLGTEVQSLTKEQHYFTAQTNKGEYRAQKVIVATGPFHKPWIPKMADFLSDDIYQVHTSKYLNPGALKEGSVLVVGAGNSGAQIAVELSKEREVYLSVGHPMKFLPLRIFGKSIFWWSDKLGIMEATIHSKLGRLISKQGDPIFGFELKKRIKKGIIQIKPRTVGTHHHLFQFEDGSKLNVHNVIWATGFRSDYRWIQIPDVLNVQGNPVHDRGVSPVEGLFFLGLPWQYRRGSALIGGVGRDAEHVVARITS